MKRPRLRVRHALWLVTGVLLSAGIYATHARAGETQQQATSSVTFAAEAARMQSEPDAGPVQGPAADQEAIAADTAAFDSADAIQDSVASGVGAGAAPLSDTIAQGTTSLQDLRDDIDTPFYARLISLLGMFVLLLIGWLLSIDRRVIPWRIILWGIGLQFMFALFILRTAAGEAIFATMNDVIVALLGFTVQGAQFLFGNLVWNHVPVGSGDPGNGLFVVEPGMVASTGAYFAFNVLPTIIFFSSLMTLLYYFGVMQVVVKGMAWVMMRTMRTSGAETLSATGNIFLGQTEAPLLIKPFVGTMTMSELMAVMTGGFATVAGGVMAAFVGMLVAFFPDIAGHLLAASVMSAPAALVFAKLMYPEKEEPVTRGELKVHVETPDANAIDAAARGAGEGLQLAANVGAMLLAFIALIALLNALLGLVGEWTRLNDLLIGAGYPAVAGQHAVYNAARLNFFHSGQHYGNENDPSTIMVTIAQRLEPVQIDALATYMEGLHRADPAAQAEMAAARHDSALVPATQELDPADAPVPDMAAADAADNGVDAANQTDADPADDADAAQPDQDTTPAEPDNDDSVDPGT